MVPQLYSIAEGFGDDPGGIQTLDPVTGDPTGPIYRQLSPAFPGAYIDSGTFYIQQGTTGYQLGPAGTNYLTLSESGAIQVQRGTDVMNINRGTSLNSEYGFAGTIGITSAEGDALDFPVTFAKMAPTGYRWAWAADENGVEHLHRVRANLTLAELQRQTSVWTRWARPEEVMGQALAGHMFRLAGSQDPAEREQFDRLLAAMGTSREEFEQDGSGTIQNWVEMNQFNLQGAIRYSFNP